MGDFEKKLASILARKDYVDAELAQNKAGREHNRLAKKYAVLLSALEGYGFSVVLNGIQVNAGVRNAKD